MNKPAIFILTLACTLALVGCSPNKETKNLSDDMPFAETPDVNLTTPGDMPTDEVLILLYPMRRGRILGRFTQAH